MMYRPSQTQNAAETFPLPGNGEPSCGWAGTPSPSPAFLTATGSQRDPPPRLSPPHCHGIPEGPPPPGSAFPIAVGYQTKTNPLPSLSLPHQSGISGRPPPQSQLSQSLWDPRGTPSPGSEPPPPHRSTPWLPAYWWMACRNFLWCFRTLAWSIFFSSLVCL